MLLLRLELLTAFLFIKFIDVISTPSARFTYTTGDDTKVDTSQHTYKVVCYIGSWAYYRPGEGRFDVDDIDPDLCTHLIYSFAGLDKETYTIKVLDPNRDLSDDKWQKEGYKRFVDLKQRNPRLKTLIAIGGWNEGSVTYSNMSVTKERRKVFISSVLNLLKTHKFDGLDMDWEYPAERGGAPEDKENFVHLLKELRSEFTPHGYLLTAAVSASKSIINNAYDVPAISRYLDFINLMCYDYFGAWDKKTGYNAPLFAPRGDSSDSGKYFNVNYTVNYWLSQGAPASKLVLGMPFYGRTFTLDQADSNKLTSPAGNGPSGPFTNESNFMGYNEICEQIKEIGWERQDDKVQMVPYVFKDTAWISYDDVDSIKAKTQFLTEKGLGGAMIWSIDTDDFRGTCGPEKFPLLRAINQALASAQKQDEPVPGTGAGTDTIHPHNSVIFIILFMLIFRR